MTSSPPAERRAAAGAAAPRAVPRPWLVRRLFPVLAAIGLVFVGMASTTWWGPAIIGRSAWSLPNDLWGTLVAAERLAHLNLGGLYTKPTGLVTLPGAALILVPVAVVIDVAGISLQVPGPHNAQPAAWLAAGPYQIAISAVVLFAADAIAERLGVGVLKRAVLAAAGAVALWNVSVLWGHPEDAVAVGLLLFAVAALSDGRAGRSAWLTGAAVAVQPLVLLALPILLMLMRPRQLPGFLARAAAPAVVLVAAAAAANWTATMHSVTNQPNWPHVDHPTPWSFLAPHMAGGAVAAGPARILTIVVACGCALVAGRRWAGVRDGSPWSPQLLQEVVWWLAVALAVRSVFEPVMVAYYLWPPLAAALVAASRGWPRLLATSAVASVLTFLSQATWRGAWTWWTPMVAGLALALFFARVPLRGRPRRALAPAADHGGPG